MVAALAAFFYRIRIVFIPFFVGGILAYAINPAVNFLERKGASRVLGTITVYVGFALIGAFVGGLLLPVLVSQVEEAMKELPRQALAVERFLNAFYQRFDRFRIPQFLRVAVDEGIGRTEVYFRDFIAGSVEGALGLFSKAFYLALAPVLAFYFTKDFEKIKAAVTRFLPVGEKARWIAFLGEIDRVLGGFIRGQLIICGFVGTLVALGLTLLKIRFALLIGIIAGILDIIPYFGPVLGAVPAVALALSASLWRALWVVVLFVVVHELESGIISPKILGDRVGLHPLAVIFALLAGGEILGIWGMLLAVPIAACLGVTVRYFLGGQEAIAREGEGNPGQS